MKGTWGKRVCQTQVEFAVAQSVSCVLPKILLTHFVCLNFSIKYTLHFDLPTSLTPAYHYSFVHLNINWKAAKIMISV